MRRAAIFYGIANSSTASLNKPLSNAPRWIVVLPLDGLGILVVFADVEHQLSPQVLHRGKHDAGYDITLNAREPVLHLVQPRRVRGCEVHAHVAVPYKEVPHALGLVAADVAADDMDLLPLALAGDELLAGVARRGLAQHLAGGGVQRR